MSVFHSKITRAGHQVIHITAVRFVLRLRSLTTRSCDGHPVSHCPSQPRSTNLDLMGLKSAPVAFFFYVMLNTFENITNKITVVHAKEVCKFRSLPPAGLE
jgi:hypothetical protein